MCVCLFVCLFACLFVCICKANTYDDNPYNIDAFFSHEKNPLRKSQLEASKQQQQVLFGGSWGCRGATYPTMGFNHQWL